MTAIAAIAAWSAISTAFVFLLLYRHEARAHTTTRRALRLVARPCSCGAETVVCVHPVDVEAGGWLHTRESCSPVAEHIP